MHYNKDRRRDRPQLVAIMNLRDDQIALRNYYYYHSICIVLVAASLCSVQHFNDSFFLSLPLWDEIAFEFMTAFNGQRNHINSEPCAARRELATPCIVRAVVYMERSANDISLSVRDNILSVNCICSAEWHVRHYHTEFHIFTVPALCALNLPVCSFRIFAWQKLWFFSAHTDWEAA